MESVDACLKQVLILPDIIHGPTFQKQVSAVSLKYTVKSSFPQC